MRTFVRIDLRRIAANYRAVMDACQPGTKLLAVVKANGYGHGAVRVARALADEGCRSFAVCCLDEGALLRDAGLQGEILLLSGLLPGEERDAAGYRLTPVLHSLELIERWRRTAQDLGRRLRCHIELETGMNRLGLRWTPTVSTALSAAGELEIGGVCTHLAAAEDFEDDTACEQIRRFNEAIGRLREAGVDVGDPHFANSAAIAYRPPSGATMARPGLALYGYVHPPRGGAGANGLAVRPALEWRVRVLAVRDVPAGERIGYDGVFTAEQPLRAALLGVGYGDGYRRDLGDGGEVVLGGGRRRILGRVSMDLIAVDVTDAPQVAVGDQAELLGEQIDAAALARRCGAIPYEILCGVSARVPRLYVSDK